MRLRQRKVTPAEDRQFLKKVLIWAFLIRIGIVIVFGMTDLIYELRLSPDSERYNRVAKEINVALDNNIVTHYTWQDHGWFRFTALVYRIFGEAPWLIQLFNVSFGVLNVYVVSILARRICNDSFVFRSAVLFAAFFPSFIYWSCLMLKDPVAILAMTTVITGTVVLRQGFNVFWLVAVMVALTVFLGVRDYMFLVTGIMFLFCMVFSLPDKGRSRASAMAAIPIVLCVLPVLLGVGLFATDFFEETHYFDLEYINHVRVAMGDHGTGAMYEQGEVAVWGDDIVHNIGVALKGAFFFFFIIDLTEVDSIRQVMALPEVILFIALLPALWRGIQFSMRHRTIMLPLVVFTFGVMAVYLSATTNMGALFRWKMQVMPPMVILITIGMRISQTGFFYRVGLIFTGLTARQQLHKGVKIEPRAI